ncbi:endonuclease [Rhodococcus sp. 15-725-2-2b]|uniref:endonuclease/exonuclease/phosphatase family protein n=1 Tax=unclassified Rhodococcus (in: high G+C Gram-positive bacteria) TaxID=192944 RepID=UPI000B9A51A9|nr:MULTISPECIES: endonuclease/exonuclease/phosphatase family protein [unclassified Rhodococcus (in: high G+C Gram-positive bacteria)]OZC61778.1 endonuclease [Rhodococcus sp. 06-469-3-2]OZD42908.1 endonuclease [Rhodococcus sp. 06-1477-1A]OZE73984.1 endonuclease [Rhodococcus sp. 15-725-2-2b]
MKIISINAWGGAMFDELVAWLDTVDAEVICLQEVTRTPHRSGWATFADGERTLPQRLNLFDDVSAALPGYTPYFVANDTGPVTDGEGVELRQDFGIATWVRDDVPVVGLDARFVHSRFVDHAEWSATDRPRAALAVTVRDRVASKSVSVIQCHGLRDPAGKGDSPIRLEQARKLAEMVEHVRPSVDVVVLCGDLNLLPTSETFALLAEHGMTDLVGDADTRTSIYTKAIRSASYVLVSSPTAVRSFEIVAAPEVSDHRALVLELL